MTARRTLLSLALGALFVVLSRSAQAPPCTAPGAPTLNSATGDCAGVNLSWTAGTGTTVVYNVYRATGTCPPGALTKIASKVASTTYSDTTAVAGTTYAYVVRGACDATGNTESPNSNCLSAARLTAPAAPTGVSASSTADSQITVSWGAAAGAASYNVYRVAGTCPGTFGAPLATGILTTSYVDNGVTAGNSYAYVVAAVDACGRVGAQSACVSAVARGTYSTGMSGSGRPQDTTTATQPVRWIFNTTASSLSPPTIWGGVWDVSNDRMVHSMVPGQGAASSGTWPAGWAPRAMNAPAQDRSFSVPTTVVPGSTRVLFIGSQDGYVYAVDANTGALKWTSASLGDYVQAAPGGIFTAFGGAYDLLFVGTRNSSAGNSFFALNASSGTTAWQFTNSVAQGGDGTSIGIVSGGASVDYANKKVYFASRQYSGGSQRTVWCLSFTNATVSLAWAANAGSIDGAAILVSPTSLLVGNNAGQVMKFNATSGGAPTWSYSTGDGPVKGFVWPDWFSSPMNIYLSTNTKVWSLTDNGGTVALTSGSWPVTTITNPSGPLFIKPASTGYVAVGSSNGRLYEINTSTMAVKSVVLGTGAAGAGTPSMDGVNGLYYVGTTGGDVYSVTAPLP